MNQTLTRVCSVKCRLFFLVAVLGLQLVGDAVAQETDVDPNRVFTTDLRWERMAGASHSEKLRHANGTLVILYLDGVYAEVSAPFTRATSKSPVELDLSEGFVMRLGTWSRTEDDNLIHIQSREVLRDKIIRPLSCKETPSGKTCSPEPDAPLPGPLTMRTCRLEQHSDKQLAEAIVCDGLIVFHPQKPIDLSDFPAIIQHLVEAQKSGSKPATR
jgi:hypothetical protein